jgi:hypothetical protein
MMQAIKHLTFRVRLLLALCFFLAVVIAAELSLLNSSVAQADIREMDAWETPAVSAVSAIPPGKPLRAYAELSDRPLFTDTRRPPPAPANSAKGQRADVASAWKLTGVVVAGEQSHAFVQGIRDKAIRRIEIGNVLDGWTLTEITPTEVHFAAGDAVTRLELREDKDSR